MLKFLDSYLIYEVNITNELVPTLAAYELRETFRSFCLISQGQSFSIEYDMLIKW